MVPPGPLDLAVPFISGLLCCPATWLICGFSCLSRVLSRRCPLEPLFDPAVDEVAFPVPPAELAEWLGFDLFDDDDDDDDDDDED